MKLDLRDFAAKGLKFAIVGAVGVGVNPAVLFILVYYFDVWYIAADLTALAIASGRTT